MTKQTRKRVNHGHRHLARKHDLRRRMKDRDQSLLFLYSIIWLVQDDMEKPPVFGSTPDLPGHGMYHLYCLKNIFRPKLLHYMCSAFYFTTGTLQTYGIQGSQTPSKEHWRWQIRTGGCWSCCRNDPWTSIIFWKTRLAAKLTEMDVESLTTTAAVAPEVVIAVEQPVESTSWSNNLDI